MSGPYPTRDAMDALAAFLGGYLDEQDSCALNRVVALLQDTFPRWEIDGITASRLLRRLGFQRSYQPEDRGPIIVYRRLNTEGIAA